MGPSGSHCSCLSLNQPIVTWMESAELRCGILTLLWSFLRILGSVPTYSPPPGHSDLWAKQDSSFSFSSGHEPVWPAGPQQVRSASHHHKVLVRLKLLRQVSGCPVGIFFLLLEEELGFLGPCRLKGASMTWGLGSLAFLWLADDHGAALCSGEELPGSFLFFSLTGRVLTLPEFLSRPL